MKPGATGEFPEGKLNEEDEGELAVAVAYDPDNNVVRIQFGTPVAWLAMDPERAAEFGRLIIEKANMAIVFQPVRPFGADN